VSNAEGEKTTTHEDNGVMSVAGYHDVTMTMMMTASTYGYLVMTRRNGGGGVDGNDGKDERVSADSETTTPTV